jgi:TerB N-terminal domain
MAAEDYPQSESHTVESVLEDAPIIVEEVERLRSIYGHNNSFLFYASNLLDAAAATCGDWPKAPLLDPERKTQEMPLRLRGALGALLKEGRPITADWALAWYLAVPAFALRIFRIDKWSPARARMVNK